MLGSRTTTNAQFCALPAVGARIAASSTCVIRASGTGSGLKRRSDRAVWIASNSPMSGMAPSDCAALGEGSRLACLSSPANGRDARECRQANAWRRGRFARRPCVAHRSRLRPGAGGRHRAAGGGRDRHPVRRHRRALRVPPSADLVRRTRLAAVPLARHARRGAGAAARRTHADDRAGQRASPLRSRYFFEPLALAAALAFLGRDPAAGVRPRGGRVDRLDHVARHLVELARRGDAGRRGAARRDRPAAHAGQPSAGDAARRWPSSPRSSARSRCCSRSC